MELQKWVMKLVGYKFEVQYRPGKENKAVNALSKVKEDLEYSVMSRPHSLHLEKLEEEMSHDDTLKNIIQQLILDSGAWPRYSLKKGRLFYKGRLVVARN